MFEGDNKPIGRSEEEIKRAEEILREKNSLLELEDPRERDPGQVYGVVQEKSYDDVYTPTRQQQETADAILENSSLKDADIVRDPDEIH